ncbi:hypothetical protein ACERCG_03730 [Mannheimia sp. E30BD]|uniref:hypothetical protein n=1 Tax=Mannheimia sp. E30BD TaxID=3278708 RepID=UPI00359D7296
MRYSYFKILIPIFILLVNGYVFLSGAATENLEIEGETKHIYRTLTKEIVKMNGEYSHFGGQVIRGFTLEVTFEPSEENNEAVIIRRIEDLGFIFKRMGNNPPYIFCKGESGFLISKKTIFRIDYEKKMASCVN